MSKLKYEDWHNMSYFMEKYGHMDNCSSFNEENKNAVKKVNPRLIELMDDIKRLKSDLKDKMRSFKNELEDTPMEDDQ